MRGHHIATRLVHEDRYPKWFLQSQVYDRAPRLAAEDGLPHKQLLKLALSLYFAMTGEPPLTGREIRSAFSGVQSNLAKVRRHLEVLESIDALPGASSVENLPDGSIEITFEPTPIQVFQERLDELSAQLRQAATVSRGKSGQRVSYLRYAVRVLVSLIEEHNPAMTLTQRERLCEELFDEVRERASGRKEGDFPGGYRTMLKRIAAERRNRLGSQSTKNHSEF